VSTLSRKLYASSFCRFLIGGALTFSTTLLFMGLWSGLIGLPDLLAYALTQVTVLVVGFFLNRRWIFRATSGNAAEQGLRFLLANVSFRFVDWCIYSTISLTLAPAVIVNVMAANLIVLPMKYFFYRHQVFGVGQDRNGDCAERAT
jgi:putative flippase GtrA